MSHLEALAATLAVCAALFGCLLFLATLIDFALFLVRLTRKPRPRPVIEEDAEYLKFAAEQERITIARLNDRGV